MSSDYIGRFALVSKAQYILPLGSDEQSDEDFGISDSKVFEEAVFSLLSDIFTADNDHITYYCKMLASRIINNQIFHKLVTSSPIIASYDKFPRLKDIENEALILTSDPYASSKFVKCLVATLQSDISKYVDKTIKQIIYKGHQDVLDYILWDLNYVNRRYRNLLKKIAKQEKEIEKLEMNNRTRS